MSCAVSPGLLTSTSAAPNSVMSDTFGGTGCSEGCGYPLDCGNNYPAYSYRPDVMGPCLYSPPFANSALNQPVCQVCNQNFGACLNNINVPQNVTMVPGKTRSSCS